MNKLRKAKIHEYCKKITVAQFFLIISDLVQQMLLLKISIVKYNDSS